VPPAVAGEAGQAWTDATSTTWRGRWPNHDINDHDRGADDLHDHNYVNDHNRHADDDHDHRAGDL
jgi:hypothetical protein